MLKLFVLRRDLVCRQAIALISDYLEGGLSPRDARRLERHLADCPHCSEYLAQMRATIAVAGQVDADELAPEVQDSLTDVYRRWRESS
jgi:anti-sigma factor RsiW